MAEEKVRTTPRQRAEAQVATTERVIKRAKEKLVKAEREVGEIKDHIGDLEARLAYEKQHPALNAEADTPLPDLDDDPDGPEPDDDTPLEPEEAVG